LNVDERLASLGITLPEAPLPVAVYVPSVCSGELLFVSGQLCFSSGALQYRGRVGQEVSLQQGYEAARTAVINSLAIIKQELGSLERVARVLRVTGYVACAPDFYDQPKVVNGASELLQEVFGEKGRHARSAIGVCALPLNSPVEIELTVAYK